MKLSVRFRVLGGYLGIILIFVLAIGTSYFFQRQVNAGVNEVFMHSSLASLAKDIKIDIHSADDNLVRAGNAQSESERKKLVDAYLADLKLIDEDVVALKKLDLTPKDLQDMDKFQSLLNTYKKANESTVQNASSVSGNSSGGNSFEPIVELLDSFEKRQSDTLQTNQEAILASMSGATRTNILATLLAAILAVIIGFALSRWITGAIARLQGTMSRAGLGDLTVVAEVKSSDEFGDLSAAFNVMITRLAEVVNHVRHLSQNLAASSEQLAATSEEVTVSVSEVSESMQTVATDAEVGTKSILEASQVLLELSSLTQIARKQGQSAAMNSQKTLDTAASGKETVEDAVGRMATIRLKTLETEELMATLSEHSKQIDSITETITGLASQTNLLALNAAIEAARAGESGRGFAVVADEVRKLAELSTQGAKDVADLVRKVLIGVEAAEKATQQSRVEVESGVQVMNQAGDALNDIYGAVQNTAKDVQYSVEVTDSEVASSEKIVQLINSVASVIETTSALAEEVAASSEEISASMDTVAGSIQEAAQMAQQLNGDVEHFKLATGTLTTKGTLEKAKTDHLLWKSRIVNMLKGIEEVSPEEVTSHQHCRLGKWYFIENNPFKETSEFKALDKPHHLVHEMALEAAKAYQAGNIKKAQKCLKELDRQSGKVIKYLNILIAKEEKSVKA